MNDKKLDLGRYASTLLALALGLFGAYLLLRYLLPVALPFLLAWALALVLRPLNVYLSRRLHIGRRAIAFSTVLLSLFLVGLFLYFSVDRLLFELRGAVEYLSGEPSPLTGLLDGLFPNGGEGLLGYAGALADHLAEALLTAIPPLLGSAVLSIPGMLLSVLVTVMAAFYFSLDLDSIHASIGRLLPGALSSQLTRLREGAMRIGCGYLRAYLLLTAVIFLIMLAGLSLLGVEYALLLSILLSAVDILPVVGVGTVLVPWGILSLLFGKGSLGIGLLVLFAVSEVVRQILEPRLLGRALGIPPLLSLAALYFGARFFGLFGLLLGPILAVLVRLLFEAVGGYKTKNPSNDGISVGQARSTLPERRQREQT